MRALPLVACAPFVALVLLGCAGSSDIPLAPSRAPARELFRFHVDLWANLHQVLFHESLLPKPGFEGPKSLAHESVAPASALGPDEAAAWQQAVAYYGASFSARDTFTPVFEELTRTLAANGSEPALPMSGLPPDLRSPITKAAEIYRARFWPDHERADLAYVETLRPQIAAHGEWMARRLEAIYQTPWPTQPVLVEITVVVPPFGATTVGAPPFTGAHAPLITMSSMDPSYSEDQAGLEMIFHEASHLLIDEVERRLEESAQLRRRTLPEGLWHYLLFYTAGHLARERLGSTYVPYAERGPHAIFSGKRERYLGIFARAWQPYLDGHVALGPAIDAVVTSL
jgi:hypothetical protein